MTPQERIKADAERFTKDEGYQKVYIAGATAEHEKIEAAIDSAIHKERNALQAKVTQMDMDWLKRAQVLVDALEAIEKWCIESGLKSVAIDDPKGMAIYHSLHLAKNALKQWKSGKGKEVGDE